MTHAELGVWILACKAEGLWVQPCAAYCGAWFATPRAGRRRILCEKYRCILWRLYQRKNGRAPPDWLIAKWKEEHGDSARLRRPGLREAATS